MKKTLLLLAIPFSFYSVHSQSYELISYFSWDNHGNKPLSSDYGPSGSSANSKAKVSSGGSFNTTGLNAGKGKKNINLSLPGGHFNEDGLSVSFDYQREEGTGWFFYRGDSFRFGISSGKIKVQYRVEEGEKNFQEYSFSNIYTIPNDDIYRNYRFQYDPSTGIANVEVNGEEVWENTTNPSSLYWKSAGNVIIAKDLDGSGNNKTFSDNLVIEQVVPVGGSLSNQVTSFGVENKNNLPELSWVDNTLSESLTFKIEKSLDNYTFEIEGVVGSDQEIDTTDNLSIYPSLINSSNNNVTLNYKARNNGEVLVSIYNLNGQLVFSKSIQTIKGENVIFIPTEITTPGNYSININDGTNVLKKRIVYN